MLTLNKPKHTFLAQKYSNFELLKGFITFTTDKFENFYLDVMVTSFEILPHKIL